MKQQIAPLCNSFSKLNNITKVSKLTLFVLLSVSATSVHSANLENKDSDGDGLTDLYEEKIGTEAYLSDTDGDGIDDGIEVGKNLNKPLNSDNDKRIDAVDYDDDNDGLPTFLETQNDTDKDGIKDYLDVDSDNDGLADGKEAGALNQDKNFDGIDDAFDASRSGAIDKNGDGIDDNLKLPDHNNDGIADYLDASYKKKLEVAEKPSEKIVPKIATNNKEKELPKSASETLTKSAKVETASVEKEKGANSKKKNKAQPKVNVNRYTDTDNDGLLDSQEIILGTNIMKRDSDGDKVSDAIEIGMDINAPQDSDHDGIIDALDNDDDNDGILTKDEDLNKDSTAINDDTDQDGVPNYLDANDDGDNRLTIHEGGVKDSDNDGILDYLDKNDGVMDKAPKVAANKKIPDEPEVVVLFDGNISSLPEEDDLAEQVIESTVSKGALDADNKESAKSSETQNINPKKVVIRTDSNPKPEKEKGGIMQWLTSLLPD